MNWRHGIRSTVGAGLVMLGVASPAVAQDAMKPQQGQQKMTIEHGSTQGKDLRQVTLTVREVDPAAQTVTFEAHVRPEAGGTTRISELKEGQQVRASMDPKTGEIVKLEVLSAPQQPPSESAQPGTEGSSPQ
jgi:hypothetical protein